MIQGVILVEVGRNLNRAIRTCYTFGVYDIYCLRCTGEIKGGLFAASGKVRVHHIESLKQFTFEEILALEMKKSLPLLTDINWGRIKYLAVGGESVTLRKKDYPVMARSVTPHNVCLTAEAALTIALYESRR